KKLLTSKVIEAVAPPNKLENNTILNAIVSNTGLTNSLYNAPIKPITFEKIRKYLLKETLEKKSTTIGYF
ncbi:hypothetical protein GE21DRAFT_1222858, partial [Neurospora crassa]